MAISQIKTNIEKVLIGKSQVTDLVLTCMVAGGHVLLEDVPGTGKTVLAKSLAKSVDASFARIQFTPDLLPSDVTGLNIYNQKSGNFELKKGPIFANIVLADEINRATPRTQSSLLECMEERQVTIDGTTYSLEEPYMVIATENPIETAGTFPLPEAQLDRFLMKLSAGIPNKQEEIEIMNRYLMETPFEKLKSVCSKEDIVKARNEYKNVYIHKDLIAFIADIVQATRSNSNIITGISPRGTLAMLNAVRAYAYINERKYVVPEDIIFLAGPVFAHRIVANTGINRGNGRLELIDTIVKSQSVPTEEWDK